MASRGSDGEPVPAANLRAYFDYMKANENRLWVATFRDAGKYARERMSSTVTTSQSGDVIEVTVNHSLESHALRPSTHRSNDRSRLQWTSVEFAQGKTTMTLPVKQEGGSSFVLYRIAPNGGTARLRRGKER